MMSFLWRKEDYVTESTISNWHHKNFPFSSPSLSKILVSLLARSVWILRWTAEATKVVLNVHGQVYVHKSNGGYTKASTHTDCNSWLVYDCI